MDKKSYNTKSRKMIFDYLEQNQSTTVTAQDILYFLKSNDITVNRSTIYRYINKLCDDGLIMKYVDNEEGKTVFQYVHDKHNCDGHIHLKCVKCNQILHLECGFMQDIQEHLEKEHNFNLQCEGSLIYGVCEQCKN